MGDIIRYDELLAFLEKASLFEIYRISTAIENELDNPARIQAVRKKFKIGDMIEYFEQKTNSFIAARVLAKNTKYVSVQNCTDGRQWKVRYHLLKIDSREFNFNDSKNELNRNTVQVGDFVGFNKDGEEVVGCVQRLNQKTVSLITGQNNQWRVPYALLYTVIDGESRQSNVIEHESL